MGISISMAYENLANAMIKQAVDDYRKGRAADGIDGESIRAGAERFLRSPSAKKLTSLDMDNVLRRLEKEPTGKQERTKKRTAKEAGRHDGLQGLYERAL